MNRSLLLVILFFGLTNTSDVSAAQTPSAASATGYNVFFYVVDAGTKTSLVKDLGVSYSDFLPNSVNANPALSINISSSTDWTLYLNSIANDTSHSKWGLVAGLEANVLNAGYGLITTIRPSATLPYKESANSRPAISLLKAQITAWNATTIPTLAAGWFTDSQNTETLAAQLGINQAHSIN